jgi:hypothetical protein
VEKNGGAKVVVPFYAAYGGNVKSGLKLQALGAMVLFCAGGWLAGCKSAPELTKAQALTLIQAKYDQSPAAPIDIIVDDRGMQQGVNAKYWLGAKRYPNGYWGDFAITPEGKKLIKLANGGDVIQWRPDSPVDKRFTVAITTLSTGHLKARDAGDVQSSSGSRTVSFTEDVNLDGLPGPLQAIAHNPGNKLSTRRLATFTLNGGAWTVQSVE